MSELKCVVESCCHNDNCRCAKGDIMISGRHAECAEETCCESFSECKKDSIRNATEHPSLHINIDCEAVKCIYNENYKCVAPHVDIKGCGACSCKGTSCATFTE